MSNADDKSNRGFSSNQGDVALRVMFFEILRDFIHVYFICKFQEHLIKTEGVMVKTIISQLQVYGILRLP